jgi:hypothetical protein
MSSQNCTTCEIGNKEPTQQNQYPPQQPISPEMDREKASAVVPNATLSISNLPVVPSTHNSDNVREFKRVSSRIIEDMCKKEEVPMPDVIFEPCPGNHSTSCTRVPIEVDTGKLAPLPSKIYLNPHQASRRTVYHEGYHYIAKVKGDDALFHNEYKIDQMARDAVDKEFQNTYTSDSHSKYKEVYDMTESFEDRVNNRLKAWKESFPMFSKLHDENVNPQQEIQVPTPPPGVAPSGPVALNTHPEPMVRAPEEPPGSHVTDSFASMLDPIYAPFANMVGVQPKDINEAHTPTILTSIVSTIAESNMNNFGSLLVNLLGAGGALAVGTLAKEQMGFGDRKFVVEMGANFLWSVMRYVANPKVSNEVMKNASIFGQSVTTGNFEQMRNSVLSTTPENNQLRAVVRDKETGKLRPATKEELMNIKRIHGRSQGGTGGIASDEMPETYFSGGVSSPAGGQPFVPRQTPWSSGGINKLDFNEEAWHEDHDIEEAMSVRRAQTATYLPTIS